LASDGTRRTENGNLLQNGALCFLVRSIVETSDGRKSRIPRSTFRI
jgi:hypothetical protein